MSAMAIDRFRRPDTVARVPSRLVFTEESPSSLLLDCVVAGPINLKSGPVPPATPFTVDVRTPSGEWAAWALDALHRWAAECRSIEVRFEDEPEVAQVTISDGGTSIVFDVREIVGI